MMTQEERDAVYQRFPFLQRYVPREKNLDTRVEETSGQLDRIRIEQSRRGWHLLAKTLRLLDKDGAEVARVGERQIFQPARTFFFLRYGGKFATESFSETAAEAIQRVGVPIYYLLLTYTGGQSFRLYTAPEGKTIAEWAAEMDHAESIPELLKDARRRAAAAESAQNATPESPAGIQVEDDFPYGAP